MPMYNVTLDDSSPMFVYFGVWGDSSDADPEHADYANQTFHSTEDQSANVTLPFNGSAIWVAGAKRNNHDQYTATLDGRSTTADGFASPDLFEQILFFQDGLDINIPHTLVMADSSTRLSDRPWFDVDYVQFTTGDGDASTVSVDVSIDDTDPRVLFSPGWSPGSADFYFNSTFHETNTTGAQVQISFDGSAITLYGATSTDHGDFSVRLDGGPAMTLSGSAPTLRPQTILYYASGLANTSHVVSIVKADTNSSALLDFDRAVATQFFPASAASQTKGGKTSSHATKHKIGPIAGGIVGGVMVIGLLCAAFLMYRRRRRRHISLVQGEKPDLDALSASDAYQGSYHPNLESNGTSDFSSNAMGSHYSAGPGPGIGPPLKDMVEYRTHSQAQSGGASSSSSGPRVATQGPSRGTLRNQCSERNDLASPELRATDAGPVLHADDLPPEYGQIVRHPAQSAGAQLSVAPAPGNTKSP